MTRFDLHAFMLLLLALLSAPTGVRAAESYDNCKGFITSVPVVITTQGTWCLKTDLSTAINTGVAITIATNNVTLDCNDFKLGGLAAGIGTQTIGIYAQNSLNTTVRHCNVRGFIRGLYFQGSSSGGNVVENNRFDSNTYIGIIVEGNGTVVRRNRVFNTGGSTLASSAYGVITNYDVDVVDNTVSGVAATVGFNGGAVGINAIANSSGRIIGNGVRGLHKDGGGLAEGIYNTSSDRVTLRDNDVVGDASASSVAGLTCTSSNGRAKGNSISGFVTGLVGCNDSGGNAVIP
jgi:parallel beta-helix repeat protein